MQRPSLFIYGLAGDEPSRILKDLNFCRAKGII
jgi:hypothetical protein